MTATPSSTLPFPELLDLIAGTAPRCSAVQQLVGELKAANDIAGSLSGLNELSYLLYALGEKALALSVCRLLMQIDFDGDFDKWSWIQSSLLLGAKILRQSNDIQGADELLEKVNASFLVGTEPQQKLRRKTLARRLNGALLYDDKIRLAVERGDKIGELARRVSQLKELCFMKEMGGSQSFPPSKIEQLFEENLVAVGRLLTETSH